MRSTTVAEEKSHHLFSWYTRLYVMSRVQISFKLKGKKFLHTFNPYTSSCVVYESIQKGHEFSKTSSLYLFLYTHSLFNFHHVCTCLEKWTTFKRGTYNVPIWGKRAWMCMHASPNKNLPFKINTVVYTHTHTQVCHEFCHHTTVYYHIDFGRACVRLSKRYLLPFASPCVCTRIWDVYGVQGGNISCRANLNSYSIS